MKMHALPIKNTVLSALLMFTTYAYSSDMIPCINIMDHFNKPALAALFPNKQNLKVVVTSSGPGERRVGCFVKTNIIYSERAFTQVNKDIGSILVYQLSDSQQIYEEDKQAYMPAGARLDWQGELPNVVQGYMSNAMEGFKAFNAYLTNGDYVIFIYEYTPNDPSTITQLSPEFINYINVMAAQVIATPM